MQCITHTLDHTMRLSICREKLENQVPGTAEPVPLGVRGGLLVSTRSWRTLQVHVDSTAPVTSQTPHGR